jgi:hypothetical protein
MCCSYHHFFQLKDHENGSRCNKSASNPNVESQAVAFPAAVTELSQMLLSAATEVATSSAPSRPKRGSLYSATSTVLLPPSPERMAKKAKALRVERTAVVHAAEEATVDLVTQLQDLETRHEEAKSKIESLETEIEELKQNNRSRLSLQSARTKRDNETSAVFDPQDQTTFDMDTDAGRKQFSSASTSLRTSLLCLCLPKRGSAARLSAAADGVPLTASILKRRLLICSLFEEMTPEIDGDDEAGFDEIILHLPKKLQAFVRLLRNIKDRLKRAFATFKNLRSKEGRICYRVLSAGAVPERVEARDGTGLMRAFTTAFDISRKPGSVPVQMQLVRENWEVAVSKVGPLEVGEAVVFTHGPGTVEALHPNGGITVKAEFGKSFTFMSEGTCF